MSYRKISKLAPLSNADRCLILRQRWTMAFLGVSRSKRRVLNVDETWLGMADFRPMKWQPKSMVNSLSCPTIMPRISMIVGLDTDGRVYFSLTQANTDSDVMTTFLRALFRQLDRETPGWQESSTILLDNASWHTSPVMKERLARLELPIIYSGPYSYAAAPIESVFSALKFGELNRSKLPTGKK